MVHGEDRNRFRGYGNQEIPGPNNFESAKVREYSPICTNPKRDYKNSKEVSKKPKIAKKLNTINKYFEKTTLAEDNSGATIPGDVKEENLMLQYSNFGVKTKAQGSKFGDLKSIVQKM